MAPLTIRLIGLEPASQGLGLVYCIYGIASIVGPPLAAQSMQAFGYDAVFYLGGCSFLLSFTCCLLTSLADGGAHAHQPANENEDKMSRDDLGHTSLTRAQSLMGSLFYSSEFIYPGLHNHELVIDADDKTSSRFSCNDELLNRLSVCESQDLHESKKGDILYSEIQSNHSFKVYEKGELSREGEEFHESNENSLLNSQCEGDSINSEKEKYLPDAVIEV